MNSLFCPQLKDNARIQCDTKAWQGCDGGMKEKIPWEMEEVLGCEEFGSLLGQVREN